MKITTLAVVLGLASAGCATTSFGRLEGVLVGDRPATGSELAEVRIFRAGGTEPVAPGMPLQKGDRIVTGPGVQALVTFDASGTEVLVDSNSELEILNPSVFLRFGRAILTRLREVAEEMKARTEYVVAAPEGTLWVMRASRDESSYSVVRGRVRIDSPRGLWPTVIYGPLEQGRVAGTSPPVKMEPLDVSQARAIVDELTRAEKTVRTVRTPFPPSDQPFDDRVQIPDVGGLPAKDAVAVLRRRGLRVTVHTVERPREKSGTVVGQSPQAGLRVNPGTDVALLVAAQPQVKKCEVPGLVGLPPERAMALLRSAGLQLDRRSDTKGVKVIRQDPPRGRIVECGSAVRIAVEKQPVIY